LVKLAIAHFGVVVILFVLSAIGDVQLHNAWGIPTRFTPPNAFAITVAILALLGALKNHRAHTQFKEDESQATLCHE